MPLLTFRAPTMRAALELVRQALGPEAVVVGVREVTHRRRPWQAPRKEMEVTAGAPEGEIDAPAASTAGQYMPLGRGPWFAQRTEQPQAPEEDTTSSSPVYGLPTNPASLADASEPDRPQPAATACGAWPSTPPMLAAPSTAAPLAARLVNDALFESFARLIDAGVEEDLARGLAFEIQATAGDAAIESQDLAPRLRGAMETHLRCAGPIELDPGRRRTVALVGPTGVGKTTTIAKLAAGFRLQQNCRVGLITADGFRVGGIDQVRTYAELLEIPWRAVSGRHELERAIDEFADLQLVLIDTAGRGPRDELQFEALRELCASPAIDEVHLVLSLGASPRSHQQMVDRFRPARPTRLLLTKLDEAPGLGMVYSAARRMDMALSYLTTGQGVPQDLEVAEPSRIARLATGEDDLQRGRRLVWETVEHALHGALRDDRRSRDGSTLPAAGDSRTRVEARTHTADFSDSPEFPDPNRR